MYRVAAAASDKVVLGLWPAVGARHKGQLGAASCGGYAWDRSSGQQARKMRFLGVISL